MCYRRRLYRRLSRRWRLTTDEYTGCGYFATLRHESLPRDRVVCHELKVVGESRGITAGFIVFIENHELMLECHDWGRENVPADFREQDVRIKVET